MPEPALAELHRAVGNLRQAHSTLEHRHRRLAEQVSELLAAVSHAPPSACRRTGQPLTATTAANPLLDLAHRRLPDPGFGVAQWAACANLSGRQLRRRVNELTGAPPRAWLREQRLQNVRRLADSGECRTLAQAGDLSGIDNPNYLYRIYRARFGPDA